MRHVRRCVRSQGEEAAADLRDRVHEQLDALGELELSIEGAVESGSVAATDAPALKQIARKREGGAIGGAASHTHPPLHPLTSTHSVTDGGAGSGPRCVASPPPPPPFPGAGSSGLKPQDTKATLMV